MMTTSPDAMIRWQCRRGMLELDVIFHRFLDTYYSALPNDQKNAFALLLKKDDPHLFDWFISDVPCPDASLKPIITVIRNACMNGETFSL